MFSVERMAVFKVSSERRKTVETFVLSASRAAERKLRRGPGSTRLTVLHKQRCVACAHFLLHDTDNLSTKNITNLAPQFLDIKIPYSRNQTRVRKPELACDDH